MIGFYRLITKNNAQQCTEQIDITRFELPLLPLKKLLSQKLQSGEKIAKNALIKSSNRR